MHGNECSAVCDDDVRRNSEHRIVTPPIQIRSLAACGLLRAYRPMTLLEKLKYTKEMTK